MSDGGVTADVEAVVEKLRASRKYRLVEESLLHATALQSLHRASGNPRTALKFAKAKLHQTVAAYRIENALRKANAEAVRLTTDGSPIGRPTLARWMALHASTAERVSFLDDFYPRIWAHTGVPTLVLDIACGLHPLARPWMGLAPDAKLHVVDVDDTALRLVRELTPALGPIRVELANALTFDPPTAHLTFLLKTLPCLEQHQTGSAPALLRRLRSEWVVASFPTRSLGGRGGKGMSRNYERQFEEWTADLGWDIVTETFPNETVFIARRSNRRPV